MTKKLILLAALFCLALVAQPAFAGGETGNGKVTTTQTLPR